MESLLSLMFGFVLYGVKPRQATPLAFGASFAGCVCLILDEFWLPLQTDALLEDDPLGDYSCCKGLSAMIG